MNLQSNLKCFLWLVFIVASSAINSIDWAVAFPIDAGFSPQCTKALKLAIDEINLNPSILKDTQINLVTIPLPHLGTDVEKMKVVSETLFDHPNVSAIFGFYTSRHAEHVGAIANIFEIPMVGAGGSAPSFSDPENMPFFSRVVSSGYDIGLAMGNVIKRSEFRRAIHVGSDIYSVSRVEPLQLSLEAAGVQFIGSKTHKTLADVSVESMIHEIDIILDELKELGARVICYTAQHEEAQVFMWRAMKKDMLNESYQWLFTDDTAMAYAFDNDCASTECASEMNLVREKLEGNISFLSSFKVSSDWLANVWNPGTTVDKLTPEEISLSGSSDWSSSGDFDIWATLSYDAGIMMANTVAKKCETYLPIDSTYEECIASLPSSGKEIMELIEGVEVEGCTGSFIMDTYKNRPMKQSIRQWEVNDFVPVGVWEADDTIDGTITMSSSLDYVTGTGIPPETLVFGKLGSFWENLIIVISGVSVVVLGLCLYLFANSKKPVNLKHRSFFNKTMTVILIVTAWLILMIQLMNAYLKITPNEDFVVLAVIGPFIEWIPLSLLFAALSSRLYRFYKVTHNKNMRMVKFHKYHNQMILVASVLIPLPFVMFWFVRSINVVNDDDEGIFSALFVLQDEDPSMSFKLTAPTLELHDFNILSFSAFIVEKFYIFSLACTVAALAKMCSKRRGVSASKNPTMEREMSVIERGFSFSAVLILTEIFAMFGSGGSDLSEEVQETHYVGFDNPGYNATLSQLRRIAEVQVISALCIWMGTMYVLFHGPLKRQWSHFIHQHSMSNTSSAAPGSKGNSKGNSTGTHNLSLDFTSRLQMTGFDTLATVDETSAKEDRVLSTSSIASSKKYATSAASLSNGIVIAKGKQVTTKTYECKPGIATVTSSTADGTTARGGENHMSSNCSKASKNYFPCRTLSGNPESNIVEFNPKIFLKELSGKNRADLVKMIELIEAQMNRELGSAGRLYANLVKIDERLSVDLIRFEVLCVKNKRENNLVVISATTGVV
eukprot:TRINITY_DN441_c0_g1_i2.p1 TRINITY_DN441_c0_g1~~TRINITY_DN441_c0_g1_i2.p1  ORF type:complete len:1007 (-),score=257.54 TRINITY_DN441_c0_g1_i2:159-3179(-)